MDLFEPCYEWHDAELVKAAGVYPYFHVLSASEGPVVTVDGSQVVMLGSNNYLGLTHHPAVLQAAHEAIDRYGTGCTGSRFLNGNLELHERLERELAEFTGNSKPPFAMRLAADTVPTAARNARQIIPNRRVPFISIVSPDYHCD